MKRPGNRPFASYSAHDPAGNYFDLSQPGHENRTEVYTKGALNQETTFSHFAIRSFPLADPHGTLIDVAEDHQ